MRHITKIYFSVILAVLLSGKLSIAQTINDYLDKIEENNTQLKAARQLEDAERIMANTGIYPAPLSIEYGYFPDNNTVEARKQTSGVTQSFKFPTVYGNQRNVADAKAQLANEKYREQRNEVLLKAQQQMIRMVLLKKKHRRLRDRLHHAENQHKGMQKKFDKGDADVMEVSKTRVHLLRVKKDIRQIETNISDVKKELQLLNGGEEIDFTADEYPVFPDISLDSIVKEKKESLPLMNAAEEQRQIAGKQVKLTKSMNLPEFKVGYGSETVGNSSFKGIVMGISVPLWSNKNKLRAAKAEHSFREIQLQQLSMEINTETNKEYEEHRSLRESMNEYRETLEELGSVELLDRSLELGQISLLDYIQELQFYYDVYDEYLELEKEYYLTLSELYRYRL